MMWVIIISKNMINECQATAVKGQFARQDKLFSSANGFTTNKSV